MDEQKENEVIVYNGINSKPLVENTNDIINKIIEEQDFNKVNDLKKLFELNQTKKDIVRAAKISDILDSLNDQIIYNVENFGPTMEDDMLVKYHSALSSSLEKTSKQITQQPENVTLQQNNINVNVEENVLSKESRDRITEAINAILKNNTIEVECKEVKEENE